MLSLLESVDLVGRYRYVELACHEMLGRSAATAAGSFAGWLSGAAGAHAWRARQFEALLPVSVGLPDAVACTVSPGPAFDEALGSLRSLGSPGAPGALGSLGSLGSPGAAGRAALVRVLVHAFYPAMLAGWDDHLAAASRAADPPLVRVLRRARFDLQELSGSGLQLVATGEDADQTRNEADQTSETGTGAGAEAAPGTASDAPVGRVRLLLERNGGIFGPLVREAPQRAPGSPEPATS